MFLHVRGDISVTARVAGRVVVLRSDVNGPQTHSQVDLQGLQAEFEVRVDVADRRDGAIHFARYRLPNNRGIYSTNIIRKREQSEICK